MNGRFRALLAGFEKDTTRRIGCVLVIRRLIVQVLQRWPRRWGNDRDGVHGTPYMVAKEKEVDSRRVGPAHHHEIIDATPTSPRIV